MPEGDTIHRAARTLRRALTGAVVDAAAGAAAVGMRRIVGQTVGPVDAWGKHLLIGFVPDGFTLHTHLMMSGSWHLYRPGQPWRKPAARATVVIEVHSWVAVCFAAPVCELLTPAQLAAHRQLRALGPDAVADGTDLAEARRRLDGRAGWAVGEALLDQRVMAGVGNVYRCEVLFLEGVNPWAAVRDVPGPSRDALLATAERLLKRNAAAASARRRTTGSLGRGEELFVYGRARRPCRRCGTPVRVRRQGAQARVTYWCVACQPPPDPRLGGTAPSARTRARRDGR